MNFRRLCTILLVFLAIVMFLVGTANVGFAQDLAEYALLLGLIDHGYIGYTGLGHGVDDDATFGEIELEIVAQSDGRAGGFAAATWTDMSLVSHVLQISLKEVGDIQFDRYGNPEVLDLIGTGKYETTNEPERAFEATVRIHVIGEGIVVRVIDSSPGGMLPEISLGPLQGSLQER